MAAVVDARTKSIQSVEVILKTVERCNIACKYCYFFFGNDDSWKVHPQYLSRDAIRDVTVFLKDGVRRMGLTKLQIDFHGGEPMMQRKQDFDWMCSYFRDNLGDDTNLQLCMQTNAMLVTDEWIDLIQKHGVGVGVSIDGPADYHDEFRVDHLGRGTHAAVVKGIRKLQQAHREGRILPIGALCVINPNQDPGRVLDFFVNDLDLRTVDFLLPENTLAGTPESYGQYLCNLFDAWRRMGDQNVNVRFFRSFFGKLAGHSSFLFLHGDDPITFSAFKISSEGKLYPDDVLFNKNWETPYVADTNLQDFLETPYFQQIDRLSVELPEKCESCCWAKVCGGGHPWNRYDPATGFNNPSSLCNGLQDFYAHVFSFLIRNGYPQERLMEILGIGEEEQKTEAADVGLYG